MNLQICSKEEECGSKKIKDLCDFLSAYYDYSVSSFIFHFWFLTLASENNFPSTVTWIFIFELPCPWQNMFANIAL